jgi:hypothetical protein
MVNENMVKRNLVIFAFAMILFSSMVFAAQEMNNPFKQNTCAQLVQSCDNCTYVNFTSVSYPDGTLVILNTPGEKHSTDYNISFCNTAQVGTYIVRTIGDLNGIVTNGNFNIYVNPSGQTFNNVLYDYLFFALIMLVFYALLYLGLKHEDLSISMLTSFGILFMGIYIFTNGIANLNNAYTNAFSIINIGLGAYILIRGGITFIETMNPGGDL